MEKQERMKEMEQKREEVIQVEQLLTAQRLSLLKAERGMEGVGNSDFDNEWYVWNFYVVRYSYAFLSRNVQEEVQASA